MDAHLAARKVVKLVASKVVKMVAAMVAKTDAGYIEIQLLEQKMVGPREVTSVDSMAAMLAAR